MATSSTCITGLVTVIPKEQFTLYGQMVLMFLSEIGAVSFMSFVVCILGMRNKKIKISDLLLAGESMGEDIFVNIRKRVKNILIYTLVIEALGAVLLAVRFVPEYGIMRGTWYSVFHSVMAFCNSGLDVFGANSLSKYASDVYVNIVFVALIIIGGIGFLVLEDIVSCIKNKDIKCISFHSKLVLCTSAFLWTVSVILIKLLSPNFTLLESIFTATTLRTAGFYTKDLNACTQVAKLICIILMFIGGAPRFNCRWNKSCSLCNTYISWNKWT
jgi:trk system potassium uptake protein TrkH